MCNQSIGNNIFANNLTSMQMILIKNKSVYLHPLPHEINHSFYIIICLTT